MGGTTDSVGIIQMKHPASTRIHLFVTLTLCAHGQGRVHVDVVTRQVQANQPLEDYTPSRPGRGQED